MIMIFITSFFQFLSAWLQLAWGCNNGKRLPSEPRSETEPETAWLQCLNYTPSPAYTCMHACINTLCLAFFLSLQSIFYVQIIIIVAVEICQVDSVSARIVWWLTINRWARFIDLFIIDVFLWLIYYKVVVINKLIRLF